MARSDGRAPAPRYGSLGARGALRDFRIGQQRLARYSQLSRITGEERLRENVDEIYDVINSVADRPTV